MLASYSVFMHVSEITQQAFIKFGIKLTIVWEVGLCDTVEVNRRFGGMYSSVLRIEEQASNQLLWPREWGRFGETWSRLIPLDTLRPYHNETHQFNKH
jgi:hypothetical protein